MSRIKKQILNKLKEYANKMGRDHLGGDDYTSKKKGGLRDFDGYDNVDYNKDMPMDEASRGVIHKAAKKGSYPVSLVVVKDGKVINQVLNIKTPEAVPAAFNVVKNYHKHKGATVHIEDRTGKRLFSESVNEGPIDRIIGGRPYKYVGDGRKGKAIVSGPMKDRERKDIIKRAQKAGYSASPGIKGGVIIFIESVNEAKFYITRNLGRGQGKSLVGGWDLKRDKKLPPKEFRTYKDAEKEIKKLSRGGSMAGQMTAYFVTDKDMNMVDKNGKRKKMFEGMFSTIDQIRQDSKDVRDFVKNVFKDRDFAKMKNDKEFIKYLKSIYEGVDESKGVPSNYMQGRTSDYHTALRGKNRDYSGGTNFKKKNHGQPDVEEEDEDQETNHLSNKQTHIKSDKLKVSEGFDKVEHLSLLNQALRAIPGSQKQKEIIRKLNKVRKAGGMRPLKEQSIVEYGQRLDLSFIEDEEARLNGTPKSKDAIDRDIDETAKRDYKDEYKKFQSSKKSKKYRAELNKYNRQKGTYGNGDGKDASHKGGKIVGFESASKNRGRKEKSRLKKK